MELVLKHYTHPVKFSQGKVNDSEERERESERERERERENEG